MKVLSIFGTRPEAIKMASVVRALEAAPQVEARVCTTGQHREMLLSVLAAFDLSADYAFDVMQPDQSLAGLSARLLEVLGPPLTDFRPDWVLVQGDTTTATIGALAAFYAGAQVGHVEAGLRSFDLMAPWPEEMNRRLVTQLASLHFAPTQAAAENLAAEGVQSNRVVVTGNTVIDALLIAVARIERGARLRADLDARLPALDPNKRLILTTGHRRESFDGGLAAVCRALRRLAERGDVEIVYPVHFNPRVRAAAQAELRGAPGAHLIEPLDYLPFVRLMMRADLIVTDSGGIQEEAPALGKPVLVTRCTSERTEGLELGTARLVGTDEAGVVEQAARLLDDPVAYAQMARLQSPYGDGAAAGRILERLLNEGG